MNIAIIGAGNAGWSRQAGWKLVGPAGDAS